MSRTAHHIFLSRFRFDTGGRSGNPWRSVKIVDLRYSAACLREAQRAGDRPRPIPVHRKVDVYSWARADPRDRSVSQWARHQERQARQRLRLTLEAIRRSVGATIDGRLAVEAADDLEVHPARHRRDAIWLY
ncbi:hypothetical protein [Streptosporangium sp. KLBMP 9127]|nr:hypothetical protein [Streptosporangium sp. KLBMP 9127]